MIDVRLVVDDEGLLSSLTVCGHASIAGGAAGENVTCAAVSGIVRACVQALVDRRSVGARGSADGPGDLRVMVAPTEADREWLRGVTDVVLSGVGRIAKEAPDDVSLTVT